jgi:hypothetical protein
MMYEAEVGVAADEKKRLGPPTRCPRALRLDIFLFGGEVKMSAFEYNFPITPKIAKPLEVEEVSIYGNDCESAI